MKTEKEYADELIEQYEELTKYGHWDDKIKAAINDVTNTIKALTDNGFNYNYPTVSYYQTVLQIIKERL